MEAPANTSGVVEFTVSAGTIEDRVEMIRLNTSGSDAVQEV